MKNVSAWPTTALRLGCLQISFIGGEVFLYQGWEKVARRMAEGGAKTNIITNAYILGEKQIAQIKEAKLCNVGISLDGMEESHDRIRSRDGSFKRVLAAFEQLRQAEIPIAVVTSVLEINFADLEPMYDLLVANEVGAWQIQIVTGMGNIAGKDELLLDPAKVGQITKFIYEKRRRGELRIYAGDDVGYFDPYEAYLRSRPGIISAWSGCKAGIKVVGIDSVGNVKGCESIYSDKFIEGNLRKESLEEIWTKEGNFAYNRNFECQHADRRLRCLRQGKQMPRRLPGFGLFQHGFALRKPLLQLSGTPRLCGAQPQRRVPRRSLVC